MRITQKFFTESPEEVKMACFYLQISVGHVEAGLRTYKIYSPYPEEFNYQVISIVSQYNFALTQLAVNHLIKEDRDSKAICITGNTVIDAMQYTIKEDYTRPEPDWVGDGKRIFITAYRRESLREPMHHMFSAIRWGLDEHPQYKVMYPIVCEVANAELSGCENMHIIEPIEVLDCHNFEARDFLCLTDCGEIREECSSYGVSVLVMKDTMEWLEDVDAGTLKLVGTKEETIYRTFKLLFEDKREYEKMSKACNPYGDGYACEYIEYVLEDKEYEP